MILCNALRISGFDPTLPFLGCQLARPFLLVLSVDKVGTSRPVMAWTQGLGCSQPNFTLQAEQVLVNVLEASSFQQVFLVEV